MAEISALSAATATTSYFELLPFDVVAAVFIFTVPDPTDAVLSRGLRRQCPLVLTEVSHAWREIAFAIPELWQALTLQCPSCTINPKGVLFKGVDGWFSRSGNRSLSLSLSSCVMGLSRHPAEISGHIPWSRVTNLELHKGHISPLVVYSIMADCPLLVTCKIWGLAATPLNIVDGRFDTHLPALSTLSIKFVHDVNAASHFLPPLNLPALQTLELYAPSKMSLVDPGLPQALTALQQKWRAPLKRLVLAGIIFQHLPLYNFLVTTPTLTELHLRANASSHHAYSRFVRQLAYDTYNEHNNILPNLETLVVEDNCPEPKDIPYWDDSIIEMAVTRVWHQGEAYPHRQPNLVKLKALTIKWGNAGNEVEMAPRIDRSARKCRLLDLRRTGLSVKRSILNQLPAWI